MASGKETVKDYNFIAGGYDLSSYMKNVSVDFSAGTADDTDWNDTTVSNCGGGIVAGSIGVEAKAEFGASSLDVNLRALDSGGAFGWYLRGRPIGNRQAFFGRGVINDYNPLTGGINEREMISANIQFHEVVGYGRVETDDSSITASEDSTGHQLRTTVNGKRLYAVLHVRNTGGTSPTLDAIVQTDDNSGFSSATDRITFTQVTTTDGTWVLHTDTLTGTDDYVRFSYTLGGTSPDYVVFGAVGLIGA